jgi:phage baseplate assembly protein W
VKLFFPYQISTAGRTATADHATWVRGLIEQIVFTAPGERVNRPTFGTGLSQLVFTPGSEELAAATEFTVQAALLQWLGELIRVESVAFEVDEEVLRVTVSYVLLSTQQRVVETFERQVLSS